MYSIRQQVINIYNFVKKRICLTSADCLVNVFTALCILLFAFFLFQNPLESIFPIFRYYDEVLLVLLVFLAVIKLISRCEPFPRGACLTIGLSILVVCIGVFGNINTGFQTNLEAIVKEIIAFSKFPIGFACASYLTSTFSSKDLIAKCDLVAKSFIILCSIFAAINFLIPDAGFGHDVRHGILSFKFIFTHPTFLVFSLVMSFVMMEAKKGGVSFFKVLCLILLATTMRDKAFGFVGFVIVSWVLNIGNKKNLFPYLFFAGVLVLVVAWPKISTYISYPNSPREALYSVALSISLTFFPLGGGLASIASSLSGEYYSSAYSSYGIDSMIGLTRDGFYDVADAGYAYYLGQFGIIGLALFLLCLFIIFKMTVLKMPLGDSRRNASLCVFAYLFIALAVENALTNSSGIIAAILLTFICSGNNDFRPNSDFIEKKGSLL